MGEWCTCLATLPLLLTTFPALSNSKIVPIGASEAVAVATVIDSHRVQREDKASPLNPKVNTEDRSSKDESLDVWCLRARARQIQHLEIVQAKYQRTDCIIIPRRYPTSVIYDFNALYAVLLEPNLCGCNGAQVAR